MLVIHPKDITTKVLDGLYQNEEGVRVLTDEATNREIRSALHRLPKWERLIMLGHGSDVGLFSREADGAGFNRIIVGHPHAFYLRGRSNIVAIWCNADLFGRKEGLHGLFSGMIISEMKEAEEYSIPTSEEELDREIPMFVGRLRKLLDEGIPLREIPEAMRDSGFERSALNDFNYSRLFYL